jgi:hypothetical protein
MKAYYVVTSTTDFVRPNNQPLINDINKELFTDSEDFIFSCYLRFAGIAQRYPGAKFVSKENQAMVFVEGRMVYECHIVAILPEYEEIPED